MNKAEKSPSFPERCAQVVDRNSTFVTTQHGLAGG